MPIWTAFRRAFAALAVGALLLTLSAPAPGAGGKGDNGDKGKPGAALARKLRELTQASGQPEWAGVLITRADYDANGVYVVTGLLDSRAQKVALERLLDALSRTDERGPLLRKGFAVRMEVLPLRWLLEELRELLPDYAEFNGVRVARAYHDLEGRLILEGYRVAGVAGAEAGKVLRGIISEDRLWKRRTAQGLDIRLQELRRDEAAAALGEQRAIDLVRDNSPESGIGPGMGCALPDAATHYGRPATERAPALLPPYRALQPRLRASVPREVAATAASYLDTTLMHTPQSGTAWFTRAMVNVARGRLLLARRDLRRLLVVEEAQPEARWTRLRKLEALQGTLRMVTNDYLEHVNVQVSAGQPRLTLVQVRAELGRVYPASLGALP
jgi:hypothetical protein